MSRLRLLFLVFALVLALPLGLLLRRTFESVEAERLLRHRTLADRITDEMERELTDLLRREEDRPYDHYRFVLPDTAGQQISPLASSPTEPFVVGYFQIDPGGRVSSPRWPENERSARLAGWQPDDASRSTVDAVRRSVEAAWRQEEPRQRNEGELAEATEPPPLDALQKLNRAALSRQERGAKVVAAEAESLYRFSLPGGGSYDQLDENLQQALAESSDVVLDVRLEPMVGRPSGERQLLLYRTVLIGEQAYRQGLVLDRPALVDWLAERVLSSSGLTAGIAIVAGSVDPGDRRFAYRHAFAEPFSSLRATILMEPLADPRGATYVTLLALLLVLTAVLGFAALYRMTAVVVRYAERRNDFVSAVTHELKTPLTAIRMIGEMLRDGMVPEEKRESYYDTLTAEGERLSRLVDNVLELSRLEKRTRTTRLVTGDLQPVIEEVAAVLAPHLDRQGFRLELDLEPDLPAARFDRDGLLQVLFNLLDNAVKYSAGAEQKVIRVSCRRNAGGELVLAVADNGPGIPRRELRRMFEPFVRGESELTRTQKGSGIGLSLVRGLVAEMGGSVRARNRAEGGLEIELRLQGAGR